MTAGKALVTRTLAPDEEVPPVGQVEERDFGNGVIRRLHRSHATVESKIMLVRLVSHREWRAAMQAPGSQGALF